MQLARCQEFGSACTFVRFGSLTTAWLVEYEGTGRKSTPFFFYFHHIIHVTSALLTSCYDPRCRYRPHRHPHQYRTRRVLLDVIHTANILFSSTSYSSRLDVIHATGILFSLTSYSSRLDVIHTAGIHFSSISYLSLRIVFCNFPLSL